MALMISVSGVRGLVGQTLTPSLVLEFAMAFASQLGGGRVVLGRDSRPSGPLYAAAAQAGLMACGCEVTDVGIAMTPTVGYAIVSGRYDGGCIITASHNPAPWNGLKFLDSRGLAPDSERAALFARAREQREFRLAASGFRPTQLDQAAGSRHAAAVRSLIETDLRPLRGIRVVLDSVNGAGGVVSAEFLRALGCDVIHMNGIPDGEFAHTPEPTAENLTTLCDAVRRHGAAIGFAQDPDADRLAIVDETGAYIGEEYTLALSCWSVLLRRPGPIAANLSTSRLLESLAERFGVRAVRTAVGEANVARGMLEHECVIGGEGNGGVIDPRVCLVRDSLSAMSLVLQLIAATGHRVSQLVGLLPRFEMIKEKFECPRARIDAAVEAVAAAFAELKPNRSDGTRVDFPEGWVHVRASNTEPIVRILAEAADAAAARALVARVRKAAGF